MPVCPVCRRSFDGRFQVFVPPHYDAFDSVACARRASRDWGPAEREPLPVILPPIEVHAPLRADRGSRLRRLGLVATALSLSPAPAAVAAGIGLAAAGTTASVYLWGRSSGGPETRAATSHPTGTTLGRTAHGPALNGPRGSGRSSSTPTAPAQSQSSHSATPKKPARSRPAKHAAGNHASATGAQHGTVSGPRRLRWRSSGHAARPASEAASADHAAGSPSSSHPTAPPEAKRLVPHLPRTLLHLPRPTLPPSGPAAPKAPGGGETPAGNTPQEPQPQKPRRSKPPQTAPLSPPTTTPPPPSSQTALPQRPGNGWGDKNHDHTGSQGQGNGHGNGHGHDDHDGDGSDD